MATRAQNADIAAEVRRLERELSAIQCTAVYPEPEPPVIAEMVPPPLPPSPPPPPEPTPELDADQFRNRDIAVLDGCWELDSTYRVTNDRTRIVTEFNDWRFCFDASGAGRQLMVGVKQSRPPQQVTCRDSLRAQFDTEGKLVISEPRNMTCSDQTFIYRRDITCDVDANGRASCISFQPQIGNRSAVGLRRSTREF